MSLKVAVIGGSGNIGSQIVKYLSERSVDVIAVARNASKIAKLPHVTPVEADAENEEEVISKVQSADVFIDAHLYKDVYKVLDEAKKLGAKRAILVGGAGSLLLKEGGPRVVDGPDFPEEFRPYAEPFVIEYEKIIKVKDYDWLFVSPPLFISAIPSTGKYRIGGDLLLTNAEGRSQISYDDFALAIADEVINSKYHSKRITVAE